MSDQPVPNFAGRSRLFVASIGVFGCRTPGKRMLYKSKSSFFTQPDAFISHSSRDQQAAIRVVRALEEKGIRCWIAPRDIVPGTSYGEAIVDALGACSIFILIFSSNANDSPQVAREVERAVAARLPIVPFRIENVKPTRSLEYFLSQPHWLDAFSGPVEPHLDYLAGVVNRLLERTMSIPKPALSQPSSNRKLISVGAGTLLLVAAVCFAATKFLPGFGAIRNAAAPSGSAGISPALDELFVGSWVFELPDTGFAIHQSISADGTFTSRTVIRESGSFVRAAGELELTPERSPKRSANWEVVDDTHARASVVPEAVKQTAQLGTYAASEAVKAATAEVFANPLWTLRSKPSDAAEEYEWIPEVTGQDWKLALQVGPGQLYKLIAELRDSGSYLATGGKWSTVSKNGVMASGGYELIDPNSIVFSTTFGKYLWKRELSTGR